MKRKKEGSFKVALIIMLVSLLIFAKWDKLLWLKNSIHWAFDPTLGALLNWNLTLGMIIIIAALSYLMTLVQKYTTNQVELKRIKGRQKELQSQAKVHKGNPKKAMEVNKELMGLMPKQMKLSMGSFIYTGIPLLLFYRWFYDFFAAAGSPKFFGFLGWFWFYFIAYFIFSSLARKWMDVA